MTIAALRKVRSERICHATMVTMKLLGYHVKRWFLWFVQNHIFIKTTQHHAFETTLFGHDEKQLSVYFKVYNQMEVEVIKSFLPWIKRILRSHVIM